MGYSRIFYFSNVRSGCRFILQVSQWADLAGAMETCLMRNTSESQSNLKNCAIFSFFWYTTLTLIHMRLIIYIYDIDFDIFGVNGQIKIVILTNVFLFSIIDF